MVTLFFILYDSINKMSGERVYIPSKNAFGTIFKEGGIMGIKNSYSVIDDVGRRQIFVGKALDNIVFVKDCKNGLGCDFPNLPVDGVELIRQNEKLTKNECFELVQKYVTCSYEEQKMILEDVLKSGGKNVEPIPVDKKRKTRITRRSKRSSI